jgi:GNAT superfamily N-acetyltransferase
MNPVHDVSVRRLARDDWELYRDLRFAALSDAPSSFRSTLAREQEFTEAVWRERLHANCTAVAFRRDGSGPEEPVGLVGGYVGDHGAELVSMWVAPQARGSGAADALVQEVCAWATEDGHLTLALWVVESNAVAERVYARNGFIRSGRVQPVRDGEDTLEYEMIRLLRPPEAGSTA